MMGQMRSRIIHLVDGQDRSDARNLRTSVMVRGDAPAVPVRLDFASLFAIAWPDLRRLVLGFGETGVAVVAVDLVKRRVAGTLALAARIGRANAAIIGRHGQCDLFLHADPTLALRHMVLIAHPQTTSGEVTYRLVDLRTQTAFTDEGGRRLESLTASGPTFVQVGSYALFFLDTSDAPTAWPEDPREAWQCVPERVYVEETAAEPDRWKRGRQGGGKASQAGLAAGTGVVDSWGRQSVTLVQTQPGPARARLDLSTDDDPATGALKLSSAGRTQTLSVGHGSARSGLLVGRYERCDTRGASVLAHHGISRVHALVIEIEGVMYAIDTGSTNGIFAGETNVRIAPMAQGASLVLGDALATMEWLVP